MSFNLYGRTIPENISHLFTQEVEDGSDRETLHSSKCVECGADFTEWGSESVIDKWNGIHYDSTGHMYFKKYSISAPEIISIGGGFSDNEIAILKTKPDASDIYWLQNYKMDTDKDNTMADHEIDDRILDEGMHHDLYNDSNLDTGD